MMKRGSGVVWSVILRQHSLLHLDPVEFAPYVFDTKNNAYDFLYHIFAPSLVIWARIRLLEWPHGSVDPPDAERLALLRDHRMLVQLHDFYVTEKKRTGLDYWTWEISPMPLDMDSKVASQRWLQFMGPTFSDFQ